MSKKRKYSHRFAVNESKWLPYSGLLFTYSGNEKIALREAFNVIEMASEKSNTSECNSESIPPGEEENKNVGDVVNNAPTSESEDEDVADSVKRFCSEAEKSKCVMNDSTKNKMRNVPIGVKHCLFISIDCSEKVYELTEKLYGMALEKPCCRYLQRVLPVEVTCTTDMPTLNQALTKVIARHFVCKNDKWPTYSVEIFRRNSDELSRSVIFSMVDDAVTQLAPTCKVNLSRPELSLLIQLVKGRAFLACVKQFISRNKLSLHKMEKKSD